MTAGESHAALSLPDTREACATEIGDYAAIGDCRSAALVSRDGSLDWLCLPDFSSPSLFGALLHRPLVRDTAADAEFHEGGGHFRIGPLTTATTSRRYLPDSNVLETTFRTSDGAIRLVDQLTIPAGRHLQPMREVLRLVEGIEGQVPVAVEIDPRPDYGRVVPALHARGPKRWVWTWGQECAHVNSDF